VISISDSKSLNTILLIFFSFSFSIDEFESDDSIDDSNTLEENKISIHSISPPGDNDYFEIAIRRPLLIKIVTTSNSTNYHDTTLTLYDEDEEIIAENDDFDGKILATIIIFLDLGFYYVAVEASSSFGIIDEYGISWLEVVIETTNTSTTTTNSTTDDPSFLQQIVDNPLGPVLGGSLFLVLVFRFVTRRRSKSPIVNTEV